MASFPVCIKSRYLLRPYVALNVTIEHYQEVKVTLPDFVVENCAKRPLAVDSR